MARLSLVILFAHACGIKAAGTAAAAAPTGPQATQQSIPDHLLNEKACKNVQELCEWHAYTVDHILIPDLYRSFALNDVEQKFSARLTELQSSSEPHAQTVTAAKICPPRGASPASHTAAFAAKPPSLPQLNFTMCSKMQLPIAHLGGRLAWLPMMLATAQMCKDEQDVSVWYACQRAEIDAIVPDEYKDYAKASTDQQYSEQLLRLSAQDSKAGLGANFPVFLVTADRCKDTVELQAWTLAHHAQVDSFIPPDFRAGAHQAVFDRFSERRSELEAQHTGQGLRQRTALNNEPEKGGHTQLRSPVAPTGSQKDVATEKTAGNGNVAPALTETPVQDSSVKPRLLAATAMFIAVGFALPAMLASVGSALHGKQLSILSSSNSMQARAHEFVLLDVGKN